MIAIDFVLFTIVSGVNAYLPLFLRLKAFSATQIGFLFGVFNMAGIIVPLILTPVTNRRGGLSLWMFFCSLIMVFSPLMIFGFDGFYLTAVAMALFAGFYKYAIPLTDSLITQSLGEHQERYGMIRVTGTIGFIVMSLIMQRFVHLDSIRWWEMGLWYSVPGLVLAVLVFGKMMQDGRAGGAKGTEGRTERTEGTALRDSDVHKTAGTALREANAPEADEKEGRVKTEGTTLTITLLSSFGPEFYLMLFVMFMQYLGMVPANQFLSIYATEKIGADISGLLWAINSIFELPFMFLSGWFIRKFGDRKIIVVCTFAVSIRLLIYAFIPSVAGCILGQCFHSLTFGLFFPACVSYCTRKSGFHKSARILSFSLLNGVTGLPVVIGSSVGGVIIDRLGYRMLFILFSLVPAIACSVYLVVKPLVSRREDRFC